MNTHPSFHRIKRLQVTGGFLIGLDIHFHDGLNGIIGPRGTGKSSVLELARYSLDIMPGREGDPLRRRIVSVIEHNLGGGRVEVTIETKDGLTYIVSRAAGEEPILLDPERKPLPVEFSSSQLFGADVYSQNQIESIAETPHYQLDLIDGFEEEKLHAIQQRLETTLRDLRANATHILPLMTEKETLEAALSQIDMIKEKLKGYASIEGQDSEEVNRAHLLKSLRDRENKALAYASDATAQQSDSIKELMGRCEAGVMAFFTEDMLTGPNGRMISDAVASLRAAIRSSEKSLAAAAQGLDAALLELVRAKGAIEQAHVPQEMAFRAVIEKQQQNQAQSVERAKLEKQQNDLLFKQRRHEEVVSQLKTLKNRRDELLARLSEERDMRFKVRDSVAERLNARLKPHIRVSIAQNADPDDYRKFLENNLRGLGIQQNRVAASISKAISPQELGELVQAGEAASLARRGGINVQQSGSVIKAFNSEERLMDLQILDMDDYPSIELCDNGVYKPSTGLSTGQKCTAILPLLMFDSVNPLLIDQPEDNLDNRFVYEAIVSSVNDVKHMRQLIFVTHNPNIPVLGDASKVVVMQSDGRTGSARLEGNVDECRAEIINLLEGGADAFRLRSERYQTTKP